MVAYYNEIDPYAAQWLRNLIAAGHITPGDVDERSIRNVHPADLLGYTQCHFFAGIGAWSHALRLANWPDERPVWTGSCPCQPFSAAGKRQGLTDDRHLWPEFHRLIAALRPITVFGEQVASKDGLTWLDIVCADLEAAGYAVGAVDICAAGFGAPHIRQRLYFVANASDSDGRSGERRAETGTREDGERGRRSSGGCAAGGMGDTPGSGRPRVRHQPAYARPGQAGPCNGFWSDTHWLPCIDGKVRPVEPGTFPLAHGATARVGRLRAYGNCIVAPQAAEIIRAYMSCRP